jgi:hypothetical protein
MGLATFSFCVYSETFWRKILVITLKWARSNCEFFFMEIIKDLTNRISVIKAVTAM